MFCKISQMAKAALLSTGCMVQAAEQALLSKPAFELTEKDQVLLDITPARQPAPCNL